MLKLIITFGMFQARLDWEAHPASPIGIISRLIEKALINSTRAAGGAGSTRPDGTSDGSEVQADVGSGRAGAPIVGRDRQLKRLRHLSAPMEEQSFAGRAWVVWSVGGEA
jgi:hypothetical protein